MDAFKITVVIIIIVSLGGLGTIFYIAQEAISNAKIPDVQTGLVISKAPVTDKPPATHVVYLNDNRVLYIQNNTALYDSIMVDKNQIYTFNCRIDYNNKMVIIEDVNPQVAVVVSKSSVTNMPSVDYSINLANGRTLYIANNATLYNEIIINQTYLFNCQIDYSNNMFLIKGAKLVM